MSPFASFHPVVMHVLWTAFHGVDTRLSQKHWLDGHLPFGLRKNDAELEPMKDRWTDRDQVEIGRFGFWASHTLVEYLKGGAGMLEGLKYKPAAEAIAQDVTQILHLAHADNPPESSGLRYVTCTEIKVALVLVALNFLRRQRDESAISTVEFKDAVQAWRSRLSEAEREEAARHDADSLDAVQGLQTLKAMVADIRRFAASLG